MNLEIDPSLAKLSAEIGGPGNSLIANLQEECTLQVQNGLLHSIHIFQLMVELIFFPRNPIDSIWLAHTHHSSPSSLALTYFQKKGHSLSHPL